MPSVEAFHLIPLPIKPSARRLPPSERSESLFIKTLEHSTAAVFATHNKYTVRPKDVGRARPRLLSGRAVWCDRAGHF